MLDMSDEAEEDDNFLFVDDDRMDEIIVLSEPTSPLMDDFELVLFQYFSMRVLSHITNKWGRGGGIRKYWSKCYYKNTVLKCVRPFNIFLPLPAHIT